MQMATDDVAFGSFRLIASRRALERDGIAVPLSSRAFDILQLLMEASDRVVGRDEIMARVWPGIAVEASNLTVQMSTLRRALGDTGAQPQLIATIPGRGYRFIGPIGASIAGSVGSDEPPEYRMASPHRKSRPRAYAHD